MGTARSASALVCLVLLLLPPVRGQERGRTPFDAAVFRDAVRSFMTTSRAPGVAAAVVDGDRVVFAEGFGRLRADDPAPVTPDSLFQLGSLSKTMTATAILQAVAAGRLSLDAPLSRYTDGLAPAIGALTVGALLSHVAGVEDEPDERGPQDDDALGAHARTLASSYVLLRPGEAFSYSNGGYALAGLALQSAEKRPFAELLASRVFGPLGMTSTTARPWTVASSRLAHGHRLVDDVIRVVRPIEDDARFMPAGGVVSSLNDLVRYVRAFMNGGTLDGKPVLARATLDAMMAPRVEVASTGEQYGYGLFMTSEDGRHLVWHGGSMPGVTSTMNVDVTNRRAVVMLVNLDGTPPIEAANLVVPLPARVTPPGPDGEAPVPESEAAAYLGAYTQPKRWTLQVSRSPEGRLVLTQFGREFVLRRTGVRRFSFQPPTSTRRLDLVFAPPVDGASPFVQFAVWTFTRQRPSSP